MASVSKSTVREAEYRMVQRSVITQPGSGPLSVTCAVCNEDRQPYGLRQAVLEYEHGTQHAAVLFQTEFLIILRQTEQLRDVARVKVEEARELADTRI